MTESIVSLVFSGNHHEKVNDQEMAQLERNPYSKNRGGSNVDSKSLFVAKTRHMSRPVGKPTMWFTNRFDTNQAVQTHKMAREWKFCI